jgi:pyruvate-formate lyase-activating enzyme
MRRFSYNVEVVGTCNLRCPSCPVGNMGLGAGVGRPKGLMDPALFEAIVEKIVRESPGRKTTVAFYDWGEPTIHPELPRFIEILRGHGLRSRVSSNLNLDKRLEEIVKAGPDEFHISLSGFYEESYSQTHAAGRVDKVKANIRRLAAWKAQYGVGTRFVIGFHAYHHNLARDLPAMRALSQEVGFIIEPVVAQLFPIEKRLAYLRQRVALEGDVARWVAGIDVTAADEALVDLLLVKPEQSDAWFRGLPAWRKRPLMQDCERRTDKMSIRVDGSLALCCVTYDPRFTVGSSFLDATHDEIQRRRYADEFCGVCMENGLHLLPGGVRQRLARHSARSTAPTARLAGHILDYTRRPAAAPA